MYLYVCIYVYTCVCICVHIYICMAYSHLCGPSVQFQRLLPWGTPTLILAEFLYAHRRRCRRVRYFSPYALPRWGVASMIGLDAALVSVHDRFLVTARVTSPTEGPLARYSHRLSQCCLSVLLPAPSLPLGPLATHLPRKWAGKQSSPSPPEVRQGTVRTPHVALPSLTDGGLPLQEALPSPTPTPSGA